MLGERVMMLALLALFAAPTLSPLITVDQFGWLPNDRKMAILAKPINGCRTRGLTTRLV